MKKLCKNLLLITRVGALEFHRSVKVIKEFFSIILAVCLSRLILLLW